MDGWDKKDKNLTKINLLFISHAIDYRVNKYIILQSQSHQSSLHHINAAVTSCGECEHQQDNILVFVSLSPSYGQRQNYTVALHHKY